MQAQFLASASLAEPTKLGVALIEALNLRLVTEYGSTMSLGDVAKELGITVVALRVRQSRYGDLPPPIPYLKERRWPTPRVAGWLCSLGEDQAHSRLATAGTVLVPRRRGRRRLIAQPHGQSANPKQKHGGKA